MNAKVISFESRQLHEGRPLNPSPKQNAGKTQSSPRVLTPHDLLIVPSLLSCDFARVEQELARCRRNKCRWVHVDVMDGHFVPNITMGPPLLAKWKAAEPGLFYDTHLMIENPMNYAEAFAKAGANQLTLHVETTQRARRDLRAIRRMGLQAGITFKPRTPLRDIMELLEEVDTVLIMTVEPGFGGQNLIPKTLNSVRELDLIRRREGLRFRLEVDGGINAATIGMAAAAGADTFVAGNAVFSGELAANLKQLRACLAPAAPVPRVRKAAS
jgi:ribulose-phosphate 3-epimerase